MPLVWPIEVGRASYLHEVYSEGEELGDREDKEGTREEENVGRE